MIKWPYINIYLKLFALMPILLVSTALMSEKVHAGNNSQQTVGFYIGEISELAVSGDPNVLRIETATAGDSEYITIDSSTTYSYTTNQASRKITGQITTGGDMPDETALFVSLQAGTGYTSAGEVSLNSTEAQTLATGGRGHGNARTITYRMTATPDAPSGDADSRVVTLTLTAQ